jgi:hypothetical protein
MRKVLGAASVLGVYAAALYEGAVRGSTREERRRFLPSDDLCPDSMITTNHAITIDAPPAAVWPWLVQMGWHRGGWYTYRWVDRLLFPANEPSAVAVLPELQDLRMGDHIPDGGPETGCSFVVEGIEEGKLLVLRSTTHLPPWPPNRWLDWVWTYTLEDVGDGGTRLLLRTRAELGPAVLVWAYRALLWTDFVMARSHLQGIKRRAEGMPFVSRARL